MSRIQHFTDAQIEAMDGARRAIRDGFDLRGFGVWRLRDGDGGLVLEQPFVNLVTDAGDQYAAKKLIQGIAPASPSAPSAATGMKLGSTSSTGPAKSGTGAALQSYLTGTNRAFDATFPQSSNLGAGLGWVATYQTTWPTGSTITGIVEAVIVNDSGTDATSSAANTYARTTGSSVTKTSTDTFTIVWNWKQLGA